MQRELEALVNRYKFDTELLSSHSGFTEEEKELLKRRIERHKTDIAEYVSSERFSAALKTFKL